MIIATTPATVLNLIDVATIRTALGIKDNDDDTALTAFVDRASDVIARHCRRVFALETVAETFRLDRLQEDLILARYPVAEIVSVVEGDRTLTATDYEADLAGGTLTSLQNDQPYYWSTAKIIVVYRAGFDLPNNTPEALKQACLQLCKSYYMSADRDPNVRSESTEAISSTSYFANDGAEHLPPDVRSLLNQFRNIRMR